MLFIFLVIATVTVVFGAAIAILYRDRQTEFRIIFGFTAGAVLGFVLMLMVHLFTEVGYLTIIVMWGGFLFIWVLEQFTHQLHAHFSNNAEEKRNSIWGVTISIIGLSIHSVMDGVNLSIAAEKQTVGIALAVGVLLHRLPVATVITIALRRDYGIAKTTLWLTPLIITPFIGAFIGERLIHSVFKDLADYLFAFALGTLLHVVMDGLKGSCVPSEEKMSNTAKIAFVTGVIITLCVMYFIPELGHEHAH